MSADRAHKEYPPVELIRSLFNYSAETGLFVWLPRNDQCPVVAGSIAGWSDKRGYLHISILNRRYLGHRLAWKFHYGVDAPGQIDHINNDPSDNRICNLRIATQSQNLANKRRKSGSKYPKGVSVSHQRGKTTYVAQAGLQGRTIFIGSFATVEEAAAAYAAAAKQIHGEFANVG